jgi:hypothetical protein
MGGGGIGVSVYLNTPQPFFLSEILAQKASGFTKLQPVCTRLNHPACPGAASRGMMAGMNKAQRIALAVGFGLFVISLFFVPYKQYSDYLKSNFSGRVPFWRIYEEADGPYVPGVLLDWTIIAVLTGGAILLLKKPKE